MNAKSFFVLWDGTADGLDPAERQHMIDETANGVQVDSSWSFGRGYGDPLLGDRIYMLRTEKLRGVLASGHVSTDGVTTGGHWTGSGKPTPYVDVVWDVMLDDDDRLRTEDVQAELTEFKFPVLGSGRRIYEPSSTLLQNLWENHVDTVGRKSSNPWLGGRAKSKGQRRSRQIPLQQNRTPVYDVASFSSYRARRAESGLVDRFAKSLKSNQKEVSGYQLQVRGLTRPLIADIFDVTNNILYEAKASASREAVRMALGQLLDYRRHIDPRPAISVLLPERPAADLVGLLLEHRVGCVYEGKRGFVTLNAGETA